MARRVVARKSQTFNSLDKRNQRAEAAQAILRNLQQVTDSLKNKTFAEFLVYAVKQYVEFNDRSFLEFARALREPFVDIEEFIDSPQFLGATDLTLWPEVRKSIIEINRYWWKGPTDGAYSEVILAGATGCVTGDTEYLTPSGWKRIDQFSEGDKVAQYHEDGTVTFVRPEEYVSKPTDGFFEFKNKCTDQQLTGEHRFIYKSAKTGKLHEKPAIQVAQEHNSSRYGFRGRVPAAFRIRRSRALPLSVEALRVMVAVIADGNFPRREGHHPRYCTVHVKKERKVARLLQLLRDAGIPYNYLERSNGYTDISFRAPKRAKNFSGFWGASTEQLQAIADEVFLWDGDPQKQFYRTTVEASAEFIQYAVTATGRRATLTRVVRESKGHTEYTVNAHDRDYFTLENNGNSKQEVTYRSAAEGEHCYCFKVPTSMWVARRNKQVFVTGNTGKTEISKVTSCYRLHVLGCMRNPQAYYGLPAATTIVFAIQAAKPHVTKKVVYMPIRKYVEAMPWFSRHMRPDPQIESEMYFDRLNVRVSPGGSDSDTILGEAIIGGIIDEANFMNVVEKSKKAGIGTGRAGTYNQAQSIYDALTRRKKGRFLKRGPEVGIICVSSSTRYKGDFTDKRIEQVNESGTKTVYVYRRAQYDVKPKELYCGDTFRIHIDGGAAAEVRILRNDEFVKHGQTLEIPIEYLEDFEKDAHGALRDIVGISTSSVNPFFRQPHKILECMQWGTEIGLESIVEKDNVVLGVDGLPRVLHGHYCPNPSKARFVHIDLSLKADRVGIAMVRHDGVTAVTRENGSVEMLPMATLELAVTIEPDADNEIDIAEVRNWVRLLKTFYGYPIKVVSYDFWNSTESRQVWKRWGMRTAYVPSTATVYAELRDAIYDKRLTMYPQDVLYQEMSELDFDEKANGNKGKVDHPPNGYKDCADAVAGAYHVMLHSPSSWNMAGGIAGRPDPGERPSVGR
jgi:hypothetical protein